MHRSLGLIAAFALAGCRACADSTNSDSGAAAVESGGPTMPSGMLMGSSTSSPTTDAAGDETNESARRLAIFSVVDVRKRMAGSWVELQIVDDDIDARAADAGVAGLRLRESSLYLTLDAMTLLHDAFANALPGFDLFVPRRFDAQQIARLSVELSNLKREVEGLGTVALVKAKWGERSELVRSLENDSEWARMRTIFSGTIARLVELTTQLTKQNHGLFVMSL